MARVHNYGVVAAGKVRIDFAVCRPPGAGDRGNFERFNTKELPRIEPVGPSGNRDVAVYPEKKGPTCLRATIVDSKIPEDAGTGIALASEDVILANSEAIKNLSELAVAGIGLDAALEARSAVVEKSVIRV